MRMGRGGVANKKVRNGLLEGRREMDDRWGVIFIEHSYCFAQTLPFGASQGKSIFSIFVFCVLKEVKGFGGWGGVGGWEGWAGGRGGDRGVSPLPPSGGPIFDFEVPQRFVEAM